MRIGRRNEEDIELAGKIEDIYLRWPFHGSRRMAQEISRQGTPVNRKRVQRLMQKMGPVGGVPPVQRQASRIRGIRNTPVF